MKAGELGHHRDMLVKTRWAGCERIAERLFGSLFVPRIELAEIGDCQAPLGNVEIGLAELLASGLLIFLP